MPDVFSKAKRSEVMSLIRSRGNERTELRLMAVFRALGITGWRRHRALRFQVSGLTRASALALRAATAAQGSRSRSARLKFQVRPDFVFPKAKVAVFVDGCFWHGCPRCYVRPKQNRKFWDAKVVTNRARDRKQSRALRAAGWTVLRLWEHELARKREGRLRRKLGKLVVDAPIGSARGPV